MAEGRFREDLFHRLNVFPIYVPLCRREQVTLLPSCVISCPDTQVKRTSRLRPSLPKQWMPSRIGTGRETSENCKT
ncbi:MAG: hypothetical protein WBL22_04850 [Candidatus Sulfotelmatobacter sp.]